RRVTAGSTGRCSSNSRTRRHLRWATGARDAPWSLLVVWRRSTSPKFRPFGEPNSAKTHLPKPAALRRSTPHCGASMPCRRRSSKKCVCCWRLKTERPSDWDRPPFHTRARPLLLKGCGHPLVDNVALLQCRSEDPPQPSVKRSKTRVLTFVVQCCSQTTTV